MIYVGGPDAAFRTEVPLPSLGLRVRTPCRAALGVALPFRGRGHIAMNFSILDSEEAKNIAVVHKTNQGLQRGWRVSGIRCSGPVCQKQRSLNPTSPTTLPSRSLDPPSVGTSI